MGRSRVRKQKRYRRRNRRKAKTKGRRRIGGGREGREGEWNIGGRGDQSRCRGRRRKNWSRKRRRE